MLLDAHYQMCAPSHLNSSHHGFLMLFYVPAIEFVMAGERDDNTKTQILPGHSSIYRTVILQLYSKLIVH